MSVPAAAVRRPSAGERKLARAEGLVLGVAVISIAAIGVSVLVSPGSYALPRFGASDTAPRFLAALALYAAGHLLRFVRLAVIAYLPGVRLRRLLQAHLLTAGLGVVLPFKLSELVRIREVGVVVGSLRRGLLVVWIERALDAAVLVLLVTVTALAVDGAPTVVAPLLIALSVFLAATLLALTILPANLRALMLHITRRRSSERSLRLMRFLRSVLTTLRPGPELVRGKLLTIAALSVLVWAAEVAVVAIALPGVGAVFSELSTAMLSLLAGISSGATALLPSSEERLRDALAGFGAVPAVGVYRLTLTLPLLLGGAAAGAGYAQWRARGGR